MAAALAAFIVPTCASAQAPARSAKAEACRAEAQSRLRVGKTAGSNRVAVINQRRAYWRECMRRA
jgi:hypothetical protein